MNDADSPTPVRRRPRWRSLADAATALGVLVVVGLLHAGTDLIGSMERRFYDHASTASARQPGDRITVVAIDDASINAIGRWPWPRDVHAELIDRLRAAGVRTVAHTVFFFEPQTDRGLAPLVRLRERIEGADPALADLGPVAREGLLADLRAAQERLDSDARLAASVRDSGRVVLPSVFELGEPRGRPDAPLPAYVQRNALPDVAGYGVPAQRALLPLPALGEGAAALGHLNQWLDPDGAVRREALLVRFDGVAVPSMALATAAHSLNLSVADVALRPGEALVLGPSIIPTDEAARVLPQFYADRNGISAFPTVSFHDVLAGRVAADLLRDRIVIVGATAAGVGTLFSTPVSPALSPAAILAHHTASLLNGHFIARPAWTGAVVVAALLLITAYLGFGLRHLSAAAAAMVTAVVLLTLLVTEYLLLSRAALWLPLVLPAVLLLAGHLALTTRRFLITEAGKRRADQESAETNRMMGLALQGQGQLDMAFDRFRRVPHSAALMDNLKHLALDFERKRQFNKAEAVYEHMARLDRSDADVQTRRLQAQSMARTVVLGGGAGAHPGGTLVLDRPGVEQPMLGRYRVEKELGKGAMGVVYQGRDPTIGRTVAIKTLALSAEFEGSELEEARKRFFREAETAGRLQHPNIVTIFDAGEEHDLAYIAMEFLHGHDLQAHTRPGTLLPPVRVLHVGEQVALALDHAHRQNVVHRDIKPANVMLDPASGQVKVTDFGIARITDSSRTKTGVVLGTPSFMAPEQLAGQRVDGRADLYALGAMLFQLLTGELPLKGDSLSALMYQIANTVPPDLRTLRPDLPAELATLLQVLLAKRAEDRPASGADVAAALRRITPIVSDSTFDQTQALRTPQDGRITPPSRYKATSMNFEFHALTDPGLVRDNNEDAVSLDTDNGVAVLADGMGGYNAGEVASAMATTFIRSELGRWLAEGGAESSTRELKRAMEICIDNANRSIFNAANANPQYAGMGTTLVMGVFLDGRVMIGHVGDSRCYRLRGGEFVQMTRDHSLLQEQIDAGLISLEQAQYATHRNLVTRALGVEDAVLLEVNEYRVEDGDLYLFCSDGLNDMLSDERIAALLVTAGTLEEKAVALVDAANAAGGRDNISVILTLARAKATRRGLLSRMLGQ